jgi:hypothetical protein
MTPVQVKAIEADLDATRARHDRIGNRKPDPRKFRSAAADPKPVTKKKRPKCLLTCTVTSTLSRNDQ